MKAGRFSHHGGPEVIRHEEVPEPTIGPADLIVRVVACAVNRLDVIQRAGHYTVPGFRLPHIAGMDVAGEVVEIGSEVDRVRVGERVVVDPSMTEVRGRSRFSGMDDRYGVLGVIGASHDGGYAELCAAPASHVHRIPEDFSFAEAACIPTCYVTAWHALTTVGNLRPGETVLINGAGGGVSTAAIQLAKRLGATVLASARTDGQLAHAGRIGADSVVDLRSTDVASAARELTDGRGVDFVFDHVGPALWDSSVAALRPRGRLVSCGATSGPAAPLDLGELHRMGIRVLGADCYEHEEFGRLLEFLWRAGFRPIVDSEFPLAAAADAHRRMEAGGLAGKIVLRP